METLLPSEIARLVYGYLSDEGCYEVAEKFLQSHPNLKECREITKQGRRFRTRVMGGRSLIEIVDLFSSIYSLVLERTENTHEISDNSALLNRLQQLLNLDSSSKQNTCNSNYSAPSSKEDDVDGRCIGGSILKPHATSTPYPATLPNKCYNDRNVTPTASTANVSARRQLLSEKENERVGVNQEALQVYIDSLNRTLLDSTQIHEKLAEKINEKITAVENLTQPDTIAKNIVTEYDFESFVDEIMETANPYESRTKDHNTLKESNYKVLDEIGNVDAQPVETNKTIYSSKNKLANKVSSAVFDDENAVAVEGILNSRHKLSDDNLDEIVATTASNTTTTCTTYVTSSDTTTVVCTSATTVTTTSASSPTTSSESTVLHFGHNSPNQPSESSKSIIEKALMTSFISPTKHTSSNVNRNNELYDSNQCCNSAVSIFNNVKPIHEQYSSAPTILINSLPTIAPSNFNLTSLVPLPVNVMSPVGSMSVPVPIVSTPYVKILPAPIRNTQTVVTTPVAANQAVPVNAPVVVCSLSGSISSSTILTSGCVSSSVLPTAGSLISSHSNNSVGIESDKQSKILIDNGSWMAKNRIHVKACNKVIKKPLTKISPKPSCFVDHQEIGYKPGSKTVLPNGVAVEVLSHDATLPAVTPAGLTENCNELNPTVGNGSDLMVIDTSRCEVLESDTPVDEGTENNEKEMQENEGASQTKDNSFEETNRTTDSTNVIKDADSIEDKNLIVENDEGLTKKVKTPGVKPLADERRSKSTPRRTSYKRALDFGTPDRRTKPRETYTSPKNASRKRCKSKIKTNIRFGLFKSPENKVKTPPSKKKNLEKKTPNKNIVKADDDADDDLPPVSPKDDAKQSVVSNTRAETLEEDFVKLDAADGVLDSPKKGHLKPETDNIMELSKKKDNVISDVIEVLKSPANVSNCTGSPMPKLTADWDAVNGLGMIVGRNIPVNNEDEKSKENKSWDTKLRSFIDPSKQVLSSSPKKKHIRRKIGSRQLKVSSQKGDEKEEEIRNVSEGDGGTKKKVLKKVVLCNSNEGSDQVNINKNSVINSNKMHSKCNTRIGIGRSNRVVTCSKIQASKKPQEEVELTDESSVSTSSSSDDSSDASFSTNANHDDLSSDLALKIERNILNIDSLSSDKNNTNEGDTNINKTPNCARKTDDDSKKTDAKGKEKVSDSKELNVSTKFVSPEQAIVRNKDSEGHYYQPLPVLETPVKFGSDCVPPQTPILDTPMLKGIQLETKVLLLTPSFPPTPAAIKAKSEKKTSPKLDSDKCVSPLKKGIDGDIHSPVKCNKESAEFTQLPKENSISNEKNNVHNLSKIQSNEQIEKEKKSKKTKRKDGKKERKERKKVKGNEEIQKVGFEQKKSKENIVSELLRSAVQSVFGKNSDFECDENRSHVVKKLNETNNSTTAVKKLADEFTKNVSSVEELDSSHSTNKALIDNPKSSDSVGKSIDEPDKNTVKIIKSSEETHKNSDNELCKSNSLAKGDNQSAKSSDQKLLNYCVSDSKSAVNASQKPKKYVKTILLSSRVSINKSEKLNPILKANAVKSSNDSQADAESQRALLDEKRQRTIEKLKGVSGKNTSGNNDKDISPKNKMSISLSEKNKCSKSALFVDPGKSSYLDKQSEKEDSDKNLNSKNRVQNSLKNNNVNELKSNNSYLESNKNDKSLMSDTSKFSTVGDENAVCSPIKSAHTAEENEKQISDVNHQSDDLSQITINIKHRPCENKNKPHLEEKTDEAISQILFLKSNEAYLHVVHDENTVQSTERKFYEDVDNYQFSYLYSDEDPPCRISMQPLQTLLEIFPSDFKSCDESGVNTVKTASKKEENLNLKRNIIHEKKRSTSSKASDGNDHEKDLTVKSQESITKHQKIVHDDSCNNKNVVKQKLILEKHSNSSVRYEDKREYCESKKFSRKPNSEARGNRDTSSSFVRKSRLEGKRPDREIRGRVSRHNSDSRETRSRRRRPSPVSSRRRSLSADSKRHFSRSKSPISRKNTMHKRDKSHDKSVSRKHISSKYQSSNKRRRSPSVDDRFRPSDRRNRPSSFEMGRVSKHHSSDKIHTSPSANEMFKISKSPSRNITNFHSHSHSVNKVDESSISSVSPNDKFCETKGIHFVSKLRDEVTIGKDKLDKPLSEKSLNSIKKKSSSILNDTNCNSGKSANSRVMGLSLVEKKHILADDDTLEEGEVVSVCGNEDDSENGDNETSMDLMDLAVTKESPARRNPTTCKSSERLQTPRKRKASDDQTHGAEKRHKPDDPQRLLKNLDSEDLEQFLSAVHSETEK